MGPDSSRRNFGLTRGASIEHIIRATLESIAFQTRDVLDAMQQDAEEELRTLRVDGGVTENNFLMQFHRYFNDTGRASNNERNYSIGCSFLSRVSTGFGKIFMS